eukprot:gene23447-biopygen4333
MHAADRVHPAEPPGGGGGASLGPGRSGRPDQAGRPGRPGRPGPVGPAHTVEASAPGLPSGWNNGSPCSLGVSDGIGLPPDQTHPCDVRMWVGGVAAGMVGLLKQTVGAVAPALRPPDRGAQRVGKTIPGRYFLGETAEDASGTRPFLQILSCGTRPGRVRSLHPERTVAAAEKLDRGDEWIDCTNFDEVHSDDEEAQLAAQLLGQL